MRVLLLHPNYHSGGAEIAGNWPPAWVAYLAGALKQAGYTDLRFIDAMTNDLSEDAVRRILAEEKPDVIGCHRDHAFDLQGRAPAADRQGDPSAGRDGAWRHTRHLHVQSGPHRGALDRHDRAGRGRRDLRRADPRHRRGPLAVPAQGDQGARLSRRRSRSWPRLRHPRSRTSTPSSPDWSVLRVGEIHLHSHEQARRHSQHGARLPLHLQLLLAVEVLARLPHPRSEEGGRRDRDAGARPRRRLLHPRRRGADHQQEEVRGLLRGADQRATSASSGASTPASPTSCATRRCCRFYRKAGLIHVSLGTEAAAQLQLDRFNKETTVAQNKKAIELLRDAGIVVEAQFIVGLENETARNARRNLPHGAGLEARPRQLVDVHAMALLRPVPRAGRQGRGLRLREVQFRHPDHEARRDGPRASCSNRVMHNYRRFYMKKALFSYPWAGTGERRRYLLGLPQGLPQVRLRAEVL